MFEKTQRSEKQNEQHCPRPVSFSIFEDPKSKL